MQPQDKIEFVERRQPDVLRLATLVSLAINVEPELLRATRLELEPGLTACVEADLWFSELVEFRDPVSVVFASGVHKLLRERLAKRDREEPSRELLKRCAVILKRVHATTSPALRLEERVAEAALFQDQVAVEKILGEAVATLYGPERERIRLWLIRAWGRLPQAARDSRPGWILEHVARSEGRIVLEPSRFIPATSMDLRDVLDWVPDVPLAVTRLDSNTIEFGPITEPQQLAISVPDTDPRLLDILLEDLPPADSDQTVSIPKGESNIHLIQRGPFRLRNARGQVFQIDEFKLAQVLTPDYVRNVHSPLHRLIISHTPGVAESTVKAKGNSTTAPMALAREISAAKGAVSAGLIYNSVINIVNAAGGHLTEEEGRKREQQYLSRVMHDCSNLDWLTSIGYQDENAPGFSLESVYTALLTTTPKEQAAPGKREAMQESTPLPALEVLNKQSRLVLTGAPGSGKSAFVNYLAVCLAGEALGDSSRNLQALTEPLPDDEGAPDKEPQAWDHRSLVPVRIILRDFATSKSFPSSDEEGDTAFLLNFIKTDLELKGCTEYYPILEARLRSGEALVLFDGLDEVADAGQQRERLIQCISAFGGSFGKSRLLVTCRPYAYDQAQWHIQGFQHAALADFGPGQICRFIDRWYANRPEFDSEAATARAQQLKQTVLNRDALRELVKRPLLLTLTAYLHANHHELPERRADLYERLLDLLIVKWEAARFKSLDAEAARRREQYSLAEFLQVGADAIRLVLERLAFQAHARQTDLQGTADIPGKDLTHQLACLATESTSGQGRAVDPLALSEYLRDRLGILHQRGGESALDAVYTFPHRSFQEFLSAAYFRREEPQMFELFPELEFDEWADLAAHLGRSDPERWREVVLLAGGIKSMKEPGPVWGLVDSLFPVVSESSELCNEDAWGLRLAGEILAENLKRNQLSAKRAGILKRIQLSLPGLLRTKHLQATERVAAGRYLARIGDARAGVSELDSMQFCYVSPGPFFLGSTKADEMAYGNEKKGAGEHDVDYAYWLARYPVTVAQFRRYVDDRGVKPGHADCLGGPANTPVVYVSWNEAMAFCGWLTDRWQGIGCLPQGYQVCLPSEPEWEKGARGGYRIPAVDSQLVASVKDVAKSELKALVLENNDQAQRLYPWGDAPEEERMNFNMNIESVSAVGAYSGGTSPYGCEEMSGNVWEWTRSLYAEYPYPKAAKARRKREGDGKGSRALRGGSFLDYLRLVRCAFRYGDAPDGRFNFIGFRVVLSPLL